MPKIVETTVYLFDELDEKAQQKALDKMREYACHDEWWEYIYDDAETMGLKITSFDLDRNRHAKGEFIGSAPECAENIESEHGKTCGTYKTAKSYLEELTALGDRPSDSNEDLDDSEWEAKREEIDDEFLRALLGDYSVMLQNESEYLSSDEYLRENILANEYTFTKQGKIF